MVFLKNIRIEDERIELVKQWPEPQSVRDISVLLGFANFYRQFILGFSQIAALLTLILKISGSSGSLTRPDKGGVGVSGDSRAGFNENKLDRNKVDGGEVGDNEIEKKVQKLFKSKNSPKSKKMVGSDFFTFGAKLVFTKLRQAFVKAPILHHFDLERHIRI